MQLYTIWLKLLYAGEDVKFIARRIMILASEDIGNADPQAICVAAAAAQAVERVGMPESQIILSQAVAYMACAPKRQLCSKRNRCCHGLCKKNHGLLCRFIFRTPTTAATKMLGKGIG